MVLRISKLLNPQAIIMDIKAKEKIAAIKELVDYMVEKKFVKDGEEFQKALAKRENLESTGIGDGIAIPHARTDAVDDLLLAFARSPEGVDFSSIDGKPSHIIFLIASPENKKSEYIMTLAKLSRLLRKEHVREQLKNAGSPKEILNVIKENEE
ncbi:MAG: PTS sugar transporter subunit IIA [Candidatus Helarchaeota archaeon]|uniref:PTS sugar transporter subunit IIA n=1 Tax=candidate division WOR-3 bacterium TaxID=2052148 RepID=A0A9C9EM85_UNCW3|nr:PTS sugar transporter subunit IIA [candidate division WOR-3 bacterium]